MPGIGTSLSLVLLEALHHLARVPSVQAFVSSGRLVKCANASAGQRSGTTGTKLAHASRPWAFSEAAGLGRRDNPTGQKSLARLENTQGPGKALTMRAHQWARAVYDRLKRATAFKMAKFIHGYRRGAGAPDAELDPTGRSLGRALCTPEGLASSNAHEGVGRRSLSPAPLLGHPLRLHCLRRWAPRCNGCCPSPEPETNGRRRPLQPPLCVGR